MTVRDTEAYEQDPQEAVIRRVEEKWVRALNTEREQFRVKRERVEQDLQNANEEIRRLNIRLEAALNQLEKLRRLLAVGSGR
jgi:uncharacterized protein YPO0396